MMSRTLAFGSRRSPTILAKASRPCWQQVRSTLARTSCVRAPFQVRLPPQTLRAITTPPQGPLGGVVGGLQAGAAQKGEQMRLLMAQVCGQPPVALRAPGLAQQPIQLRFQPPGGRPQAVQADQALLITLAQVQRFLQEPPDGQRKARRSRRNHPRQLPTAPQQTRQPSALTRNDPLVLG